MQPRALDTRTTLIAGLGALLVQVPVVHWIKALMASGQQIESVATTSSGAVTLLVYVMVPTLVSLVWIWFFAIWGEADGWARIGLRPGIGHWPRAAVLTGVASVVIGVLVVSLTTPVLGPPEGPPLPISLGDPAADGAYLIVLFVAAAMIAPVFEEMVFRGILFGWLRRHLGVVPATVLAALPHAAIHFDPATIPVLSVIFVLFAFLYERTGTLKAPILAHCVHNACTLAVAYYANV